MFYNYNSLSFLLFYVFHLLVTVINGQQHLQQPQPVPSTVPRQVYGYHKITAPNGALQYHRSYNLNNTGFSEQLYMSPHVYGRSISRPSNRQTRNIPGYSSESGSETAVVPELFRSHRYYSRSAIPVGPQMLPQPQLPPQFSQLSPQFPSRLPPPMSSFALPVVSPSVTPNVPRYGPIMSQNQDGERAQHQSEYSSKALRQTVSGNEVTVPHSYTVRDEPMTRVIDYFSSDSFKKYQQENKLGTVGLFKNIIIGTNTTIDEGIIRANLEKTGHNFNNGTSDCMPMPTVVKFGNINQPEIIYNPSSVQVLRCPQACFSWQFDCIPVKKISYNFIAAVYTMDKDKVTREVNQFEVVSHTECACQCKAFASCLSSPSMSSKRPKSNF